MSNYKPLNLDSELPFGKYKGIKVSDVLEKDEQYIEWLKKNTSVRFNFSKKSKVKRESKSERKSKKEVKLTSVFKSGKYEGLTVAEVIMNDKEYVEKHYGDKLHWKTKAYLSNPQNALKGLWREMFDEFNFSTSESKLVRDATYHMKGMLYMVSLRVEEPEW